MKHLRPVLDILNKAKKQRRDEARKRGVALDLEIPTMITVPIYREIVPGLPESQARRQLKNALLLEKSTKEALMCQADVAGSAHRYFLS